MRYIIFDLDGTLAVSANYEQIFLDSCATIDIDPERARHFWHHNQGLPLKKQFQQISSANRATVEDLEKYFWSAVADEPFTAVSGANDVIKKLYGQGCLLFITTGSTPARLNQCLDQLGWFDYFYLVQGSDKKNSKGPEHYRQMAASVSEPLSAFVEQAAIIGDGAYDMSSARDAGIARRIGLLSPDGPDQQRQILEESGAEIIITALSQLPDILGAS